MEGELEAQWELLESVYQRAATFLVDYSFQIIGAIIIFLIGLVVARWVGQWVLRFCLRYRLDETFSRFISNAVRVAILAGVLVVCLGKFGISIAPFVAAIGAVSLGAGLALQGPVSNYGAGIAIILSRPFVVGNTIAVRGVSGLVITIGLASTVLETEDGEHITIPNKQIIGEIIHNSYANRVAEQVVGIAHGSDAEQAIALLRQVLEADPAVTKEPAPQVGIQAFTAAGIEIGYRFWTPTKQYFPTVYRVNMAVWKALRDAGIAAPMPSQTVHLRDERVKG